MQSPLVLGVDVAKAEVVVACSRNSFAAHAVANTPSALRRYLKTLPTGSAIALESTGVYHQAMADIAVELGHTAYVLNPRNTHNYAKAVGLRAKTDRVDAQLIARYLAHEQAQLHPYVPPTPEQRTMDRLLRRRSGVIAQRNALRLSCGEEPSLKKGLKTAIAALQALIAAMDAQIAALIRTIPGRQEQTDRLRSVVGIGPVTSAWLANLLERVPFKSSDALVAFAGMDPRPRDSGAKRGQRFLSKRGPAEGRRLLFNAAMAGIKSPVWAPLYQQCRNRGLASTEALIVIARKMLRVAFALYKTQTDFNPQIMLGKA